MKLVINAISKQRDSFGTLHVTYRFTEIKTGEYWYYSEYFDEGSHHEHETDWQLDVAKSKATKEK